MVGVCVSSGVSCGVYVCICVCTCVACVFVCVLSQVPVLTLALGHFSAGLRVLPLPAAHRQLPVLYCVVHWGSADLASCAEVDHPPASLAQAGVLSFSFVVLRPGSVLGPHLPLPISIPL